MGNLWSRFRNLPGPLQALVGLALIAGYTVAIVLVVSGGDGGDGPAKPRERTALEQRVASAFDDVEDRTMATGDVADFRKPRLRDVMCDGTTSCAVVYAVGLPGTGRILEQQQPLAKRVLVQTGVARLTMTVVRGPKSETGVPLKSEEETSAETVLVRIMCDRRAVDAAALARMDPLTIQRELCRLEEFTPSGRPNTTTVPPP